MTRSPLQLNRGARPWEPMTDASDVEVLLGYDMPFVGLFRSGSQRILFTCLDGQLDDANVWAYAPMNDESVSELLATEFDDVDKLMDWASKFVVANAMAVAAAAEDRIVVWAEVEQGATFDDALSMLAETVTRGADSLKNHVATVRHMVSA